MSYMSSSNKATENYIKSTLSDQRTSQRLGDTVNNVSERLDGLEAIVHAMWIMLKKQGVTIDDLHETLAEVTELRKTKKLNVVSYDCPKCGRKMQVGVISPIIAKCVYCNAEKTISPLDKYENIPEDDSSEDEDTEFDFNKGTNLSDFE